MARKVRVLHTLCRVHSGGVEQLRVVLARGLPQDRYEHVLLSQESTGPVARQLIDAGWRVHDIGIARNIFDRDWHRRAYDIAHAFAPDIVHGAVYEGVALAVGIGIRMRTAAIISEETSDPVDRRWTGNLLMRAMLTQADRCIAVSPKVETYLSDTIHVPRRKVRLINNAVAEAPRSDATVLRDLRVQLGIADDAPVIGSVGRLRDSQKRFSDLIRAIPDLLEHYPALRLVIVGGGEDEAMLRSLAAECGVAHAVVFAGYQGDTRPYYELMDIFILASAHEAFGLVLVEAMLAGVPVVGTSVGGIPFVLDEGSAGRLVPPCAPKRLAAEIAALLGDASARAQLADAGRARAHAAFAPERYCREMDDLYQQVLR
jgi:glycosyltransferase involved in cell wall biosynthesis